MHVNVTMDRAEGTAHAQTVSHTVKITNENKNVCDKQVSVRILSSLSLNCEKWNSWRCLEQFRAPLKYICKNQFHVGKKKIYIFWVVVKLCEIY